METSFESLFSTVVLETISFEPDISSMRSNVAIVKNELILDSTDCGRPSRMPQYDPPYTMDPSEQL